jgi:flagellin
MISLQTNIDSLVAQQNLNVDSQFQSNTIQQLTSGYRINSSADDAAGLSVANGYRNQIASLNQGVLNAAQGTAQLQIVDGGLSNISQMLDRLQTLATESASTTFSGSRSTLDGEYQGLLSEVDRQASNIGLSSTNSSNNSNLTVYIGGGNGQQANAQVSVDLSGAANLVDSAGLGLAGTNVLGGVTGGVLFDVPASGSNPATNVNDTRLDDPTNSFVTGGSQTFNFNYVDSTGATQSRQVVVNGGTNGVSGADVITQLNNGLAGTGITASINSSTASVGAGTLQLSSTGAFTASASGALGGGTAIVDPAETTSVVNGAQYNFTTTSAAAWSGATTEKFTVTNGSGTAANIVLTAADAGTTISSLVGDINSQLKAGGISNITALATNGGQISFQSNANFSIAETAAGTIANGTVLGAVGSQAVTAATTTGGTAGTDALSAITAISNAVAQLGLVQGVVGAGENKLNYASNLAQSQITNFTAAQSSIRDANVAEQAANMTKSQVLEQASIAAMAQANQEPQAVLKLLQG